MSIRPPTLRTMTTNRVVALLTPLAGAAAAWLTGWVFQTTGVKLDGGLLATIMVAELGVVAAMADRWLRGWQAHEQRTAVREFEARGRRHDDGW